jgi:GT2 family glycosyltransferase
VFYVARLMQLYPVLGVRPIWAGLTVYENGVWVNDFLAGSFEDGTVAEVKRTQPHLVGIKDEVFFCDCEDYRFGLRAFQIADGSYQ